MWWLCRHMWHCGCVRSNSHHHRRGAVCRRISLRTRAAINPLIDFRNARVIGVCFGLRERGDIQTNHAEPSGSVATSLGLSNAQAKKAVDAVIAGAAAKGEKRPSMASASRSEEHTSELQSLMRISYAVFCLKKKKKRN